MRESCALSYAHTSKSFFITGKAGTLGLMGPGNGPRDNVGVDTDNMGEYGTETFIVGTWWGEGAPGWWWSWGTRTWLKLLLWWWATAGLLPSSTHKNAGWWWWKMGGMGWRGGPRHVW
jgi:hypothetical protein